MTTEELLDHLSSAPVAFGLKAQGKLETVQAMRMANATWDEIGQAIGWEPNSACEHYLRLLEKENTTLRLAVGRPIISKIDPTFWPKLMHIVTAIMNMDGGAEVMKAWGKLEDDAKAAHPLSH